MSVVNTRNNYIKRLSDQGPLSKWIVEVYDYMKEIATSTNDHEYLFLFECMMVKASDPTNEMVSQDVVWNLYKWIENSRNYYRGDLDETLDSDKWPKMSVEAVFSIMDKCKSINSHYTGDIKKDRETNYTPPQKCSDTTDSLIKMGDDLAKGLSTHYTKQQEHEYHTIMGDSDSDYSIDIQDDDYDETSGEYATIHPGDDQTERQQVSQSLCGNE